MRILIPVDGSKPSLHSIDFLTRHSDLLGDKLDVTILNVQPPVSARIYAMESPESIEKYYHDEAASVINMITSKLPEHHKNITLTYRIGEPAETIAHVADSMDADLIVFGSRGHHPLGAFLFGSVSNAVIARVRRPILILREQMPRDDKHLKVGVAVDGSAYSERAMEYITKHRAIFGKDPKFTLIHASTDFSSIAMPSLAGVPIRTMNRREVSELQDESFEMAIKPLRPIFDNAGIKYDVARVTGNPGDAVADYVRDNNIDLLVMGSHGYDNVDALLLGSVAMRIAAVSEAPLLIIR